MNQYRDQCEVLQSRLRQCKQKCNDSVDINFLSRLDIIIMERPKKQKCSGNLIKSAIEFYVQYVIYNTIMIELYIIGVHMLIINSQIII